MTFYIRNFAVWEIGGVEIWLTETMIVTWAIMLLLLAFAVVVRVKLSSFSEQPAKFQNVVETIVEMLDKFVASMAGPKLSFLGNWFFMVFAFVMLSNFSGAFGVRPPTADWTMTFALAIVTFVLIQVMGLRYQGWGYIKTFFVPHPLFFPLNLIGELARPISLSFRLFGNVLAGLILLAMVYNVAPIWLRFALPAALHGYFDIIIGFLQAYIFCTLSLAFISGASGIEHD